VSLRLELVKLGEMLRNFYVPAYEAEAYPSLELTFAQDIGQTFLIESSFQKELRGDLSHKLVDQPSLERCVRAICIALLLAKYRGEPTADREGKIPDLVFRDTEKRGSWIDTLGMSFGPGVRNDFFDTYFENLCFVTAGRGNTHTLTEKRKGGGKLATVKYRSELLRLKNLRFFRATSTNGGDDRREIKRAELPALAKKLEAFYTSKKVVNRMRWFPIVGNQVAQFDKDLAAANKGKKAQLKSFEAQMDGQFIVSRDERLIDFIWAQIAKNPCKGTWYVVADSTSALDGWESRLIDAVVQHGSNVKMLMRFSQKKDQTKDSWLLESVKCSELITNFKKTIFNATRNSRNCDGCIEIYQTDLRPHVDGVFFCPDPHPPRPRQIAKFPRLTLTKAPEKSWCFVFAPSLLPPFAGVGFMAMYLHRPSLLLDSYLDAFTTLFRTRLYLSFTETIEIPKKRGFFRHY
jgi:hypothetical protein